MIDVSIVLEGDGQLTYACDLNQNSASKILKKIMFAELISQ